MLTLVFFLVKLDRLVQLTISSHRSLSYVLVKEIQVLLKSFDFKVCELKTCLKKLLQEKTWLFVNFFLY